MKKKQTLNAYFTRSFYVPIILASLLVCVCAGLLTGVSAYRTARGGVRRAVEQRARNVETHMEMVEGSMRSTIYSTGLQEAMIQYRRGDYASLNELKIRVNDLIGSLTLFFSQAENVAVYAGDGTLIGSRFELTDHNVRDYEWFEDVEADYRNTCWLTELGHTATAGGERSYVCSVAAKVRARSTSADVRVGDLLGYLVVEFNFSDVGQLLHPTQEMYDTYLLSAGGVVLASSRRDQTGEAVTDLLRVPAGAAVRIWHDGAPAIASARRLQRSDTDWYCVCLIPEAQVFQDTEGVLWLSAVLAGLVLVCACFVARRNAGDITAVFERLRRSFARVEQGDWGGTMALDTDIIEIEEIARQFNHMATRLDDLLRELLDAESRKQQLLISYKEAELQNLQMQINPHFLYNTLDTISWMALEHGEADISEMVIALGRLFRSSIEQSTGQATIGRELERVELYMYLQHKRFGDRLRYQVEAEEAVHSCPSPGFLLQPLVENAIQHGISPYKLQGEIRIAIHAEAGLVHVRVSDNGRGMPEEILRRLRDMWEALESGGCDVREEKAFVGLHNILKRLRLLYGEDATFSIDSGGGGTVISIAYPEGDGPVPASPAESTGAEAPPSLPL